MNKNKKYSLVANVAVPSTVFDATHTEQARIVREMAERELQTRISLVELDRAERFVSNADPAYANLIPVLNPDIVVDVPQSVPNGATRHDLQMKGIVGLYRTPEAQARKEFRELLDLALKVDNLCYFLASAAYDVERDGY